MPLPIVLGGKSVSAQTLPGPCGRPDEADDGELLEPVSLYQTQSWGVCPKQEWLVRVTCSYYDLVRASTTGRREYTKVEVAIQISPMTRPLSSDYREISHHLRLLDGAQDEYPQTQPQVVVSSDRRNLAVLLFHPHQQSSQMVVFQLRKPRRDIPGNSHVNRIPLPSYCTAEGQDGGDNANAATNVYSRDAPAVATHPRFVSVWGISNICRLSNVTPGVFLAACHDGSLVWLDAGSSMAVATGHLPRPTTPEAAAGFLPLVSLSVAPSSVMNQGQILAVGQNGCVSLTNWRLESSTPLQRTLLKRASTGNVLGQSGTFDDEDDSEHNPQSSKTSVPTRSMSDDSPSVFSPQRMKALLSSPLDLPDFQLPFSKRKQQQQEAASKNKQGMDEYVLTELQKGGSATPAGTAPERWKPTPKARDQQLRRRSDHVSTTPTTLGNRVMDNSKRHMHLEIVSLLQDDHAIVDAKFANLSTMICVLFQPDKRSGRVAQMFSVCGADSVIKKAGDGDSSATFEPVLTLRLSAEQVEHAFRMQSSSSWVRQEPVAPISDESGHSIVPETFMQSRLGLDHDATSDTFAISTTYDRRRRSDKRWVGCLWNWQWNAIGWTIQHVHGDQNDSHSGGGGLGFYSRLLFGKHPRQGTHLVFLESSQDKYLHLRKEVVSTGLLAPASSLSTPPSLEPCSLLLSYDSIRFPHASPKITTSDMQELEWKVSTLPQTYLNSYGPPLIAAAGRQNGHSLAVASTNGVCVLEQRNYRWKQFGTPQEEKSFQIVAMAWWEGHRQQHHQQQRPVGPEHATEDLLVAIVLCNNGRQYLSCWSPRRLDLSRQLLVPCDALSAGDDMAESWGTPLSREVKITSLSILAEPERDLLSSRTRKAVVLVSSSDARSSGMTYATFRLQVGQQRSSSTLGADSYHDKKPYHVLVQPMVEGVLKNNLRSVSPIASVFVAGATFDFDLAASSVQPPPADDTVVATIGVVRNPGGIEALSLSANNSSYCAKLLDDDEVSKFWMADTIDGETTVLSNSFVWSLELLNGQFYCWTVPYRLSDQNGENHLSSLLKEEETTRPKGLRPPRLVCQSESRKEHKRLWMGTLCHIGSSSDWMQQSSSGTQTDISLGLVPGSTYGCVLRAGQHARKLHRSAIGDFDTDLFASDFLESEVFGPSEFLMVPPAFVSSLYVMVLELAYLRMRPETGHTTSEAPTRLSDEFKGRVQAIENHIDHRLLTSPNKDAAMMAIRLLILRSVELLNNADKRHEKRQTEATASNLRLAASVFSEIVDTVRRCTTNLQFASLFLEVGRQIEPSCLPHLFPLPFSSKSGSEPDLANRSMATEDHDRFNARSVVELFSLCIEEGSLAASASALPLLASRVLSRNFCDLLLARSIEAFVKNTDSSEADFDVSQEERRVIGDIFRFGIRLEDAATLEEKENEEEEESVKLTGDDLRQMYASMSDSNDTLSASVATIGTIDSADHVDGGNRAMICVGAGQPSSFLGYVLPSIFADDSYEEDAIRRAASSFIDTEKELASMDFLNLNVSENAEGDLSTGGSADRQLKSVAGLVGEILIGLLHTPKVNQPWKTMSALARLLLQHGSEMIDDAVFQSAASHATLQGSLKLFPTAESDTDQSDQLCQSLALELDRCQSQTHPAESNLIVDLVLRLLQRLSDFTLPDEHGSSIAACLVVIGVIAGHVSDRTPGLLEGLEGDSFLVQCYEDAGVLATTY